MAKMRIYTVHIQPRKSHPYESPVFIEEAFNFYALIFAPFWALYHRLWLLAIGLFLFEALSHVIGARIGLHPASISILQLAVKACVGFHACDLRRYALKKRGYIMTDVVTGDNLVGAEQRFFERYYPNRRKESMAASPVRSGDVSAMPG